MLYVLGGGIMTRSEAPNVLVPVLRLQQPMPAQKVFHCPTLKRCTGPAGCGGTGCSQTPTRPAQEAEARVAKAALVSRAPSSHYSTCWPAAGEQSH